MNFGIFRLRMLKTKMVVFSLAIFLSSIWSLAFYASRMLHDDMERELGEQQFSTVSLLAEQVNEELNGRFRALESIAKSLSLPNLESTADVQALLEQRPIFQGLFNGGVVVLRLDGTVIADVPLSTGRIGVNLMERESVASALKEGKSSISRPVMGKKLAAPIFHMTAPIWNARGQVIGALSGVTNLGSPNFLDKITENRYGKTGGYVLLIPKYRLIVTATDKSRIMQSLPDPGINPSLDRFLQGYEGSAIYTNPLGVEVLGSAKQIPVSDWLMGVTLPTKEAFAPVHAMQQRMLLTTIFMTVLAGGLMWWMLKFLLSPMVAAARTLATLSDTDQPSQPLPITNQDEIGDLIGGFNRLLEIMAEREEALRVREERHRKILQTAMDGFWMLDMQGGILEVNETYCRMSGYSEQELLFMRISDLEVIETDDDISAHTHKIMAQGEDRFESRHRRMDGSIFDVEVSAQYQPVEGGRIVGFLRDITDRKRAEAYGEMGREVLQILNEPEDLKDSIQRVLVALRTRTGFDAVGIRLQDGNDFPYYAQKGFSKDFLLTENTLIERSADGEVCQDKDGNVRLECTCGLVISGRIDPANPLFTRRGSFWTNDSLPLLDIPLDEDLRFHPRNRCIHQGYASVALVPIRSMDKVIGMIQLNDHRKGCFTLDTVELLEGIASHIGAALMRKQAEDELRKSEEFAKRVIESSDDCIKVLDLEGHILSMNEAGQKLLEIDDLTSYLNKSWVDFWKGKDRDASQESILKAMQDDAGNFCGYCETAKGTPKWWEITVSPIKDSIGNCVRLLVVSRDITERRRIEEFQTFLAQTTTGTQDENFFEALARFLAESLGMDFVCIDRLEGDGLTASTVAIWSEDKFEDNVTYALKDTPCGEVVGKSVCCFPASVCQFFPRDQVLLDLRAESYIGVTLFDYSGRPIGLIAVIGRSPLTNRPLAESLLKMVAVRAAAEMERLDAETELRYERDRAQGYLDTVETIIVALNTEGRINAINRKGCQLFGYGEDELVGRFWFSTCLHQPDGMENVYPFFIRIISGEAENIEYFENPIVIRSGELRQIAWHNSLLRDDQGVIIGTLSCGEDITERRQAENALKKAHDELEMRVRERTADLVSVNASLGLEVIERRRREKILNVCLQVSEFSAAHSLDELLQKALDEIERLTASRIGFFHFLEEDQKTLSLQTWSTSTINTFCTAEGKGRHYNLDKAGIWVDCIHQRRPVVHNDYAGLSNRKGLPPGHAAVIRELVAPIIRGDKIVAILGVGNKDHDYDAQDAETVSNLANMIWDIVQRKQVEKRLFNSNATLTTAIDGISDPLIMLDAELRIIRLNKAARNYYRLATYQEAVGKHCFEAFRGRLSPCEGCEIPFSNIGGYSGSYERKGVMDPDKVEKVFVDMVKNESGEPKASIVRIYDITKSKMQEKQLIQNAKLASLGLLISSIAHEINNPNTLIFFNIPILRDYLQELTGIADTHAENQPGLVLCGMPWQEFRTDIFKLLDDMEHGSSRINTAVAGLKEFSRTREHVEKRLISIEQVIERALTICGAEVRKRVKSFNVVIPDDLSPLFIDPDAVEQVLVNLIINAIHALDKEDSWITVSVLPDYRNGKLERCFIEVADNGSGMDEKEIGKIFDPFFTTKGSGMGTGLGLYVCQNLIEKFGGSIEVDSQPGVGSTFRVLIPDVQK